MNYNIFVVLIFFSLLVSCSDEKVEPEEPEFPEISKTDLNNFLSRTTIFLHFGNIQWSFDVYDMQGYGSNFFINCADKDTIALTSGLVNPDGRNFYLNAGVVPYNDDVDALTKHFSIGDKTVDNNFAGYNISMNDPKRRNITVELLRIKVIKTSFNTQLYWNYERKIKVWFLMDFNIKDNTSGEVIEKIRNAKYINEFFLMDYGRKELHSGRTSYEKITTL